MVVPLKGSRLVGRRDFREFFVENLIFYNYLLILKVHIFSNSRGKYFFCGEEDFSEPDHLKSKSEGDSVSILVYLVREQRIFVFDENSIFNSGKTNNSDIEKS